MYNQGHMRKNRKRSVLPVILLLFCLVYFLPSVIVLLADRQVAKEVQVISLSPIPQSESIDMTVTRESGETTVDLEDYVFGVVAGEMPATFELEALKAQAIAARTYIIHSGKNEAGTTRYIVTDSTFDQVYKSTEDLKELWQDNYVKYEQKLRQAVVDTQNQVLVYQNDIIFPAFFFNE